MIDENGKFIKGFLRMAAHDFNTWNNNATFKARENGFNCSLYTYSLPDIDPYYVWARVEHDFIESDIILNPKGNNDYIWSYGAYPDSPLINNETSDWSIGN